MAPTESLSIELEVFERNRRDWSSSHPGEYVTIRDEIVEGFFSTYAEALQAGLRRFGASRSFLVKQVWLTEPVYLIS